MLEATAGPHFDCNRPALNTASGAGGDFAPQLIEEVEDEHDLVGLGLCLCANSFKHSDPFAIRVEREGSTAAACSNLCFRPQPRLAGLEGVPEGAVCSHHDPIV